MGQANQDRTQEWQLSTGLQNHLSSGPQELCKRRRERVCVILLLIIIDDLLQSP